MEDLLSRTYRLINLYNSTGRKPYTYSCGETLYQAQVHFLECLYQREGETISSLSREMYMTRSAASQTAELLQKKELITRDDPAGKGGAQGLYLSEKGLEVIKEHRKRHSAMIERIGQVWQSLDENTRTAVTKMLDIVEEEIGGLL